MSPALATAGCLFAGFTQCPPFFRNFFLKRLVCVESLQALPYTHRMDNERIREFCLTLPHVEETVNWGHQLVFWVGNREIGGKMFAMTDLDGTGTCVLLFHCGVERFHELLENDGIIPAPHLARAHWVGLERWNALRPREIEEELRRAHALIYDKLPKRTKSALAMPEKERAKILRSRKKSASAKQAKR